MNAAHTLALFSLNLSAGIFVISWDITNAWRLVMALTTHGQRLELTGFLLDHIHHLLHVYLFSKEKICIS